MKRLGGIWEKVGFGNLLLAYRKAWRGKGRSVDVARFALDLESELLGLQRELESGDYARSRSVQEQAGCGARVSMSPSSGLAWT